MVITLEYQEVFMDAIFNAFKDLFDENSLAGLASLRQFFANIGAELRGAIEFLANLFSF